ncbi:MAG: TlpA family protein disulfide reductase [Treponema sp.]|jgi:thiol-disulfide isomerase/thioredoxin|nr:TlpA family protein disulfide reductase [Treponema sp.]
MKQAYKHFLGPGKRLISVILAVFLLRALPLRAEEPAVGKEAPDFTFTAPDGRTVKLSDYRGKPLALHFWATWCGPCIRELPLIAALASKSQELTTLAVNCAETDQEVSAFLKARKLSLDVVMDRDGRISRLYNIYAIPQTVMIDAGGRIKSIRVGAYNQRELNRDLSALLSP